MMMMINREWRRQSEPVCFSVTSTSASSPPAHAQFATLPAMAAAAVAAAQRLLTASTKIIGVGRNYIAHAKELVFGALPARSRCLQEPVLFLKPTSSFLHASVTATPAAIEVPDLLDELHHEVELAVIISKRGRDVPEASAMDFVGGN
ncbi:hypothetical protein PR202_ga14053 [Eleusine coracana subsp. coracana]|uniref:Fumarylacetoacetase-like C-terminal domain-containing protein n=1 Tax=Eleusine coracana subsp. coracana TaxID=191504 RepID=A0AAV5CFL4_ELECO|nr:hypothetical protein PR202_ga14053 [Eleusine coracana subsp. coracana]